MERVVTVGFGPRVTGVEGGARFDAVRDRVMAALEGALLVGPAPDGEAPFRLVFDEAVIPDPETGGYPDQSGFGVEVADWSDGLAPVVRRVLGELLLIERMAGGEGPPRSGRPGAWMDGLALGARRELAVLEAEEAALKVAEAQADERIGRLWPELVDMAGLAIALCALRGAPVRSFTDVSIDGFGTVRCPGTDRMDFEEMREAAPEAIGVRSEALRLALIAGQLGGLRDGIRGRLEGIGNEIGAAREADRLAMALAGRTGGLYR